MADIRTTTSKAAPTSPPEGINLCIRRKECRRAVRTHYGPTRRHQARYSPTPSEGRQSWHYDTPLISAFYEQTQALLSDDHGPAGAAGAWATQQHDGPHPPGPQDLVRDCGPDGAAEAAAQPSVQQDLSRDYGPTGSSGRCRRLRRGRSTFGGTMGRGEPPDGYA
jgi:hypothetical protein